MSRVIRTICFVFLLILTTASGYLASYASSHDLWFEGAVVMQTVVLGFIAICFGAVIATKGLEL